MENINIEALKKAWYSFEEIEWIKLWLEQANNLEVISKKEMNNFIKNKLLSDFKVNVFAIY